MRRGVRCRLRAAFFVGNKWDYGAAERRKVRGFYVTPRLRITILPSERKALQPDGRSVSSDFFAALAHHVIAFLKKPICQVRVIVLV